MTIIVGIDPGAVDTGVVIISYTFGGAMPTLLASLTVSRPDPKEGRDLLTIPPAYLRDVQAAALAGIRDYDAAGVAFETVKRPAWRVGGKVKPLDPTAIMATSMVVGALLGREWPVPAVTIAPMGNGRLFPLTHYPAPLATAGKGHDKRRHERSAFDVAVMGAPELASLGRRATWAKP